MRRTAIGLTVIALAAAWWAIGGPAIRPDDHDAATAGARSPEPPRPSAARVRRAALNAISGGLDSPPAAVDERGGALRDTTVDGALAVDARGELMVNSEMRRFFEYFFVASGEAPEESIRAEIAAAIAAQLDGDAERRALALLADYLRYRARGRTLAAAVARDDDLRGRLETLTRLRHEVFGPDDAAALFSDEEALAAATIEERRILSDRTLSDTQRAQRLDALAAAIPEPVRAARQAATAPFDLARDEAALRAAGGTAEEVQALREGAVGADAAARLAALDQRRAAWQARVDAYRSARDAISESSLDATQREAALAALRREHFSGPELVRIEALDRLQR
jgi:lipase chaperone LimK